jgi:hypothetical protein
MQSNYSTWSVENAWGFEINEGIFKGTVIQIEDINFVDNDESGNLDLKFHVISTPEHMSKDDLKGDEFTNVISNCMNDILAKALEVYSETK